MKDYQVLLFLLVCYCKNKVYIRLCFKQANKQINVLRVMFTKQIVFPLDCIFNNK